MQKIIQGVIYLSWIILLVTTIYDLFLAPPRSLVWIAFLSILIIFYTQLKNIPKKIHLIPVFIILMHLFGEVYFELFYVFPNYDKILHLINPILLSILIYSILKSKGKDNYRRILATILILLILTILWELLEFALDQIFGSYMQGVHLKTGKGIFSSQDGNIKVMNRTTDTILDSIISLFGIFISWIFLVLFTRKPKLTS